MKKVFAVVLAVLMLMNLAAGCSRDKKGTPPADSGTKIADNLGNKSGNAVRQGGTEKPEQKQATDAKKPDTGSAAGAKVQVEKGKAYTDKDHVAAYIHVYKTLPPNFITKGEAARLGWKNDGTLDKVAPGRSIGGDRFGNYEKKLPDKQGRVWKECDIDYVRGNRNAKRICYSNDGLIYYSASHYRDFVRLY